MVGQSKYAFYKQFIDNNRNIIENDDQNKIKTNVENTINLKQILSTYMRFYLDKKLQRVFH